MSLAHNKSFMVSSDLLMAYDEFASFEHEEKGNIIDFIQYAYHMESPFVRMYESINDRLQKIGEIVQIKDERAFQILFLVGTSIKSVDDDELAKLEAEQNQRMQSQIDSMISCFLSRIQNNYKFELYITYQSLFSEYCSRLRSKVPFYIDEDKALKAMETKVKITQPSQDLISSIERLRKEIFGNNTHYAEIIDKKVSKGVEYYAKNFKKG